MIDRRTKCASDAQNPEVHPASARDPLVIRVGDLILQERDAVRRRDWSAARAAAEERVALQTARQRAAARQLA
jgi:hypothetical protein